MECSKEKRTRGIILVTLIVLGLGGCGDEGSSPVPPPPSTAPTSAATTSPSGPVITWTAADNPDFGGKTEIGPDGKPRNSAK